MLTVEEAIKNIDIIVGNTNLNRAEHGALMDSIKLVAERCELADKLEAQLKAEKEAMKVPVEKK